MSGRKPPAESEPEPLDQVAELRKIYDGLAREFGNPDTSSARASLGNQMMRTLREIEAAGKGESAGSGIGELVGRSAAKVAPKTAAKRAARKPAAKKTSKTPSKTRARKSAPRRKANGS